MATQNNKYGTKSFLKNTGVRKFFLDVSNLPKVPLTNGEMIQVPPECENRIDLFSYQQYGSSRLWWVIALANADIIRDPTWDFKAGLVVFVPRDESFITSVSGAN